MTTTTLSTSDAPPVAPATEWGSLLDTSRLEKAARSAGWRTFAEVPETDRAGVVKAGLQGFATDALGSLDDGHALVVEELLRDAQDGGELVEWSALAQLLHVLAPFMPETVESVAFDAAATVCDRPVRDAARVGRAFAEALAMRYDVRTVGGLLTMILSGERHRAQLLKIPRVTSKTLDAVLDWAREQSGCSDSELAAACVPNAAPVPPGDGEQGETGTETRAEAPSPETAEQAPSQASEEPQTEAPPSDAEPWDEDPDPARFVHGDTVIESVDGGPLSVTGSAVRPGYEPEPEPVDPYADTDELPKADAGQEEPEAYTGAGFTVPHDFGELVAQLRDARDWICRACGARFEGQPQPEKENPLLRIRCTECESGFCAPFATVELARLREEVPQAVDTGELDAARARVRELEGQLDHAKRGGFGGGLVVLVDVVPWRFRGELATLEAMLGDRKPTQNNYRDVIVQSRASGRAVLVDSRSPFAEKFIAVAVPEAAVFLRGAR